jgi:hypothetical protein
MLPVLMPEGYPEGEEGEGEGPTGVVVGVWHWPAFECLEGFEVGIANKAFSLYA